MIPFSHDFLQTQLSSLTQLIIIYVFIVLTQRLVFRW